MLFCDPAPGAGKLKISFSQNLLQSNPNPYHHLPRSSRGQHGGAGYEIGT